MDKVLDMISIHALREESDQQVHKSKWQPRWFQSTLSARRATGYMPYSSDKTIISIHALREESDTFFLKSIAFYLTFQSTLSARRATDIASQIPVIIIDFNPRSPRGERQGGEKNNW